MKEIIKKMFPYLCSILMFVAGCFWQNKITAHHIEALKIENEKLYVALGYYKKNLGSCIENSRRLRQGIDRCIALSKACFGCQESGVGCELIKQCIINEER